MVSRIGLTAMLALAGLLAATARSQTESPNDDSTVSVEQMTLTAEDIQEHLDAVQNNSELADSAKKTAIERYNQALEQLKLANGFRERAEEYQAQLQAAPAESQKLKEQLDRPRKVPTVTELAEKSLNELEQEVAEKQANLAVADKAVQTVESDIRTRNERKLKIPQLATAAQEQLTQVTAQLASPQEEEAAKPEQLAQQTLLKARQVALREEQDSYAKELAAYQATGELLTNKHLLAVKERNRAESELKAWKQALAQKRGVQLDQLQKEITQTVELAQDDPAVLREIAEINRRYAREQKQVLEADAEIDAKLTAAESSLRDLGESMEETAEKLKVPSIKRWMGQVLRTERDRISQIQFQYRSAEQYAVQAVEASHALDRVRDELKRLADLDLATANAIKNSIQPLDEQKVRSLLQTRRELLTSLVAIYDSHSGDLAKLNNRIASLLELAQQYATLIDEHILWLRSTQPLVATTFLEVDVWNRSVQWLLDPARWNEVAWALLDSPLDWAVIAGGALLLGLLIVSRRRLRHRIHRLGERVQTSYSETYKQSLLTMLLTLLLASTVPAIVWMVGWLLITQPHGAEFVFAAGSALQACAVVALFSEWCRQVCPPGGLGETHFRWRPQAAKWFRKNLYWLLLLELPFVFVAVYCQVQSGAEMHADTIGRLALIFGLIAFAVFTARVLDPRKALGQEIVRRSAGTWLDRGQWLWFTLLVLTPLAMAAVSFAGYHYTAYRLTQRLLASLWLIFAVLLGNAMIVRWLFAARGRLAMEQAKKLRDAQAEAVTAEGLPIKPPVEPEYDLSAINVQTRQLLRASVTAALVVGLWLCWVEMLPALGILKQVSLGSSTREVGEWVQNPDGTSTFQSLGVQTIPLTLADVLLAVLIIVAMLVASRNIPGLLEITLLKRLPLDAGGRYAFSTVAKYVIVVAGVIAAAQTLGFQWSNVQWLVAAMTVGLGFGLQEIFANFVSGLILLFERPIRVGDIVTIDNVSGVVSKIRMRATTITDWDNKDFIVPNKEFITGRLLNWTLTDTRNRVEIVVGIAYGADTEQARQILLRLAHANPFVLKTPEPLASFEGFGNSSLKMVLRFHLPNLDNRLQVINDMHTAIHREFAKADIAIALPQMDLHIRSFDEKPASDGRNMDAVLKGRSRG